MNFDELCQEWQKQKYNKRLSSAAEVIQIAKQKTKKLKANQTITISVLSMTLFIISIFYYWVNAFQSFIESIGLIVMILMLFTRLLLEYWSKRQMKSIEGDLTFKEYNLEYKKYFKNRRLIHFILSPMIYFAYILAFYSLLPLFKENVSNGLYQYIMISGLVVFVFLAIFIIRQIKKEHDELRFVNSVLNNCLDETHNLSE